MAFNSKDRNKRNKERIYNALENVKPGKRREYTSQNIKVTTEPFQNKGQKVYKTTTTAERVSDQWEAKISIDQALQPSNKDTWEALKERSNLKRG